MELPATSLTDPAWLADDLRRARRLTVADPSYRIIRWYSPRYWSPPPNRGCTPAYRDPALDAVTFDITDDGRFLDAYSTRTLGPAPGELAAALVRTIDAVVTAFSRASGASPRALWAIAIDSIANRLLWAGSTTGDADAAKRSAEELAEHMAHAAHDVPGCVWNGSPRPRFTTVGGRLVVRRSSCCLVYEAPATLGAKCVSCPRQTPTERERRLRTLLGP